MKLTTKSIFSPAARPSKCSSLSRRNGSLKGGASPFFTTKKREQENQEPSSPKVTCIGQVRVLKTKKKKNKKVIRQSRNLSRRDVSNSHNQRWAHLPISMCEALKAVGAEFSWLFPCKSPCFVRGKCEGREKGCFVRWLVSVNEEEEKEESGKRREIEVVGGGNEVRSSRRHVFEDSEVKDIESVCVPPKNALLLMRCRFDPMKVAALASRFTWDASKCEHGNEVRDEDEDEFEGKDEIFLKFEQDGGVLVESSKDVNEVQVEKKDGNFEKEVVVSKGEEMVECDENEEMFVGEEELEGEEVESNMSSFEALLEEHQESVDHQNYEDCLIQENEQVSDTDKIGHLSSCSESQQEEDDENRVKTEPEEETCQEYEEIRADKFLENKESEKEKEKESQEQVLPDCLLLMIREPKLSMEVSKETWVCTNDFIRWLPQRQPKKSQCHHAPVKRALSMESKPKKIISDQPRWSCSLPASMTEQKKLVNAAAVYDPLVLTRCKSEPMRTVSAKLVLEPHRRATVGTLGSELRLADNCCKIKIMEES